MDKNSEKTRALGVPADIHAWTYADRSHGRKYSTKRKVAVQFEALRKALEKTEKCQPQP